MAPIPVPIRGQIIELYAQGKKTRHIVAALKVHLRKAAARTVGALRRAVGAGLASVTEGGSRSIFRHCRYATQRREMPSSFSACGGRPVSGLCLTVCQEVAKVGRVGVEPEAHAYFVSRLGVTVRRNEGSGETGMPV